MMRREKRLRQAAYESAPELTRVVPMADLMEKEKWLALMENRLFVMGVGG